MTKNDHALVAELLMDVRAGTPVDLVARAFASRLALDGRRTNFDRVMFLEAAGVVDPMEART